MKLKVGRTILIGMAFLSISAFWQMYDNIIPLILEQTFGLRETITGVIMAMDNVLALFLLPLLGSLSDKVNTAWGKRTPFIVGGTILAILFMMMLPVSERVEDLTVFIICLFGTLIAMGLYRSPAVALMPDLTPPELRSEGNAIINLMGGVGSVVGMVAGTLVSAIYLLVTGDKVTSENEQETSFPYVFLLGAIVMIIGMLVVRTCVKEPSSKLEVVAANNQAMDDKAAKKAAKKAEKLSKGERKSLIFMLGGLFFLFCGTNAITTFFALFAAEVLGKSTGEATIMTTLFAVCSAAAAIPAGKMGKKIGRKKTILIGLVVFMAVFLLYVVTGSMTVIWLALILGGAANMFITVNTLPLVLEIGGIDKVGTFTGYYYTATFSAQIASPIVYGIVRMFSGTYLSLFVYSPIMFILSILCILFVKHGEAIPQELVDKIEEENAD